MKNMCLLLQRIHDGKEPHECKGSVENFRRGCSLLYIKDFQLVKKLVNGKIRESLCLCLARCSTWASSHRWETWLSVKNFDLTEVCLGTWGGQWLSTEHPSLSVVLRLLNSTVDRLPGILNLHLCWRLTDFDTPNSFPLKMRGFLKAWTSHLKHPFPDLENLEKTIFPWWQYPDFNLLNNFNCSNVNHAKHALMNFLKEIISSDVRVFAWKQH